MGHKRGAMHLTILSSKEAVNKEMQAVKMLVLVRMFLKVKLKELSWETSYSWIVSIFNSFQVLPLEERER